MKIAVLKEQAADEQRVSATPETVKKFIGLGATLAVEQGAGESASIADADYAAAGATVSSRADVMKKADIILDVHGTSLDSLSGFMRVTLLVASLNPFGERSRVETYAAAGLQALAMAFMPRIQ